VAKDELVFLPLKNLKPYENNPRFNQDAVDEVVASIQEFGFRNPIIVDKNNVIVCGHTRYLALKRLKWSEPVPCLVAKELTDEQIKAYRLADNKVGELASWNVDLLLEELDGIADIDMSVFGFDLELPDELEIEKDYEDDLTQEREAHIKFKKWRIPLTADLECFLDAQLESYLNANGVLYGFLEELIGGFE